MMLIKGESGISSFIHKNDLFGDLNHLNHLNMKYLTVLIAKMSV